MGGAAPCFGGGKLLPEEGNNNIATATVGAGNGIAEIIGVGGVLTFRTKKLRSIHCPRSLNAPEARTSQLMPLPRDREAPSAKHKTGSRARCGRVSACLVSQTKIRGFR